MCDLGCVVCGVLGVGCVWCGVRCCVWCVVCGGVTTGVWGM